MMNGTLRTALAAGAALFVASAAALAAPGKYAVAPVTAGGKIAGRVTYKGKAPARQQVAVPPEHLPCCGGGQLSEDVVVDEASGGLANAVVSIRKIDAGKDWPKGSLKVTLDQKGCVFVEHVAVVRAGADVTFTNSDDCVHNVKSASTKNTFNPSIPGGEQFTTAIKHADKIKLTCGMHPWMEAWLFVTDHPYAEETAADGAYEIADVPAGTYDLEVWHEKLGKKKQKKVEVEAGETTTLDWTYP